MFIGRRPRASGSLVSNQMIAPGEGKWDVLRGGMEWLVEPCMAIVSLGVCNQLTTSGRKLLPTYTASRFCNLTDETSTTSCSSTAFVRTFGLDSAGSVSWSKHSTPELGRILSTEFTKTMRGNRHVKLLYCLLLGALLNIRGNCAGFRSKSAHFSGHLPLSPSETSIRCLLS